MLIARLFGYAAVAAVLMGAHIGPVSAERMGPSKWGEHDTLGSANYLSSDLALKAAELVTEGKVYALGIPVGSETPAVAPRSVSVTVLMPDQYGGSTFGSNEASYLDDMITGWLGVGTQIDSLAHAGKQGTFYNGNRAIDFVRSTGVTKLGIDGIPPIVTRGVLIDIARYRGVARLEAGEVIDAKELRAAAEAQGVEIREGDVVILHTGWLSVLYEDAERFLAGQPGIDRSAAEFLVSRHVVAVGADNWGLESVPFQTDAYFDVHVMLLAENGTYILEALDTRELAADRVYEFMFVLGQPRFVGAVQAIVNPIAIK